MKKETLYENYRLIDTKEYTIADEYSSDKYIYARKSPVNNDIRENKNRFMFKVNVTDVPIDIAEEVAYKIANSIGISCCRAEVCKRKRNSIVKDTYDVGVRSFYNLSQKDKLISSSTLVNEYIKYLNGSIDSIPHLYDFELIMKSILHRIMKVSQRPYSEFLNVRQQFIDMMIFDLKFANYDRGRDNWMLRHSMATGEFSLYPMYDNEAILGFDAPIDIASFNSTEISDYSNSLKYPIVRPLDKNRVNYLDMMEYLLEKYPKETKKSMEKVFMFTYEDLEHVLDEYENLHEDRKKIIKKIFLDRDLKMKHIYKTYLEKEDFKDIGG